MRNLLVLTIGCLAVAGCDGGEPRPAADNAAAPAIAVRSAEQDRMHQLNELDLSIALKRAIVSAGYRCQRVEDAGFVAKYKNLDMWTATCSNRQWAIFAGPDGTAQVRDCGDVARFGLPECKVEKKPDA